MIIFKKAHPATRTMIGGDPTPEQAMAGDYPKLRREWRGLPIAIEHPEGTVREGIDETGKPWRTVFRYAYGEILGTLGMDGDPVDVFIGSYADAPEVYIVQQMKRKQWDVADEQKVMIDFGSIDEAKAAYLGHYDDPRFFGGITAMPVDEFIAKVRATKQNPAMIKSVPPDWDDETAWHGHVRKRSDGMRARCGAERMCSRCQLEAELLGSGGSMIKAAAPVVMFFKGFIGPYLRGAEPQHTEPTRELIEEHERLVDALNSPSHEDDKDEAKKQAAELAEMKREVGDQMTKSIVFLRKPS